MGKKITAIFSLLLMFCIQAQAQEFESATDAVKNMGVGWNLGNTLEANRQTITDVTNDGFWGQQGLESETCWGQSATTPEFIKMMKNAGFGAIRVPVTWYNHMDKDGHVDAAWMKRVKEVIDYVINEGLYCIVNVHHDTGADSKDSSGKLTGYHWIKADKDNFIQNADRFETLWKQIAEEFKDYDQHLLFEAYNEMLDANSCWNYPTFGMNYDADYLTWSLKSVNAYAQRFVNTVRATGGNNATRNLIVNTYAAASGGNWGHCDEVVKLMEVPTDNAFNHLIIEVHSYPDISKGLSNAKSTCDIMFQRIRDYLQAKGVPVIMGEWGTSNVDNGSDYIDRRKTMISFLEYFVKACKENNIATFYWMGLSDGAARSQLVFNQPDLAEAITKAYHGDNFQGEYPAMEVAEETVVFEGEQQLQWGQAINFPANLFTDLSNTSTVEVTYTLNYANLDADNQYGSFQFWYNDWSSKINVIVDGQTYNSDFSPAKVYGTGSGTEHTTIFSFDAETFHNFKKKGMLFQGHGILVKKAVLKAGEKEPDEGDKNEEVFWEGDALLNWGDGLQLTVPAENFEAIGKDVRLVLTYTTDFTDYDGLQLFYGDWDQNNSVTFTVEGKEYTKDFKPSVHYGIGTGETRTTEFLFNDDVLNLIFQKGIVMQGHGIRLNKVLLTTSAAGIQSIIRTSERDHAIYNLSGLRVSSPRKGIYIQNGKKYVIK